MTDAADSAADRPAPAPVPTDWDDPPRIVRGDTAPVLSAGSVDGPLDWLLEVVRARKINLATVSIAALAGQFADALAAAPAGRDAGRLDRWAGWTVMAATLTELWSRLLLPGDPAAARAAEPEAEALRRRVPGVYTRARCEWRRPCDGGRARSRCSLPRCARRPVRPHHRQASLRPCRSRCPGAATGFRSAGLQWAGSAILGHCRMLFRSGESARCRCRRCLMSQRSSAMRLRAGDDPSRGWHAAPIKACLSRTRSEEPVPVSLDPDNLSQAYQLGRLFAVLEKAQREALGCVNASIADRYYGATSATPARVFGALMRGAKNHISAAHKLARGYWIEGRMQQIIDRLPATLPTALRLEDQGRFAIGDYHERAYRSDKLDDCAPSIQATAEVV
jgi:hypothetical protein